MSFRLLFPRRFIIENVSHPARDNQKVSKCLLSIKTMTYVLFFLLV